MKTWSVIFGLVILAFAAAVLALNSTLYSAHGFVQGYLDSLARHDVDGALALPGVRSAPGTADDLLTRDVLGELGDIRLVTDVEQDDGTHRVVFAYSLEGDEEKSEFRVVHTGSLLGVFSTWRFVESPLSTVSITVLHNQGFDANGASLETDAAPNEPADYAVFTPGRYTFDHDSSYLTAASVEATVTEPSTVADVVVDVQANVTFVAQVQKELDDYLDNSCVTQEVLLPTECPFGQPMSNRIVSTPAWSISQYPAVTIVPGDEPGTWLMPDTPAAAHLVVDVRSLFDGSVTTFDEDVPFTMSYLITLDRGGKLFIQALY